MKQIKTGDVTLPNNEFDEPRICIPEREYRALKEQLAKAREALLSVIEEANSGDLTKTDRGIIWIAEDGLAKINALNEKKENK